MLAATELSPHLGQTDEEKKGIMGPRRRKSSRGGCLVKDRGESLLGQEAQDAVELADPHCWSQVVKAEWEEIT